MRLPLDGNPRISTEYMEPEKMASLGKHLGIDWAVPVGTKVYSPGDGVIIKIYTGAVGGKTIEARINGKLWRFLHLNTFQVKVGQQVKEGQQIATSGKTGDVTGPHLHADVRKDNTAWNASLNNYFDPRVVVNDANRPAPAPVASKQEYVILPREAGTWSYYNPDGPYARAKRIGFLDMRKYGTLEYPIEGRKPNGVVLIRKKNDNKLVAVWTHGTIAKFVTK